jgi:hypothetical protein
MSRALPLGMLLLSGLRPAESQGPRRIDSGSFLITVGGQRVGREDFTIDGTPSGDRMEYLAHATIALDGKRTEPVLRTDSTGAPTRYQVELRRSPTDRESWVGFISRGRVSARMESTKGRAEKEYLVTDGAIVLDDDVFHQYFFIARKRPAATITVMIPRRNTQMTLRLATVGPESVAIANRELAAIHLTLTDASGSVRDLWVDEQDRVLKVAIPSRNLIAVRDEPPQ